MTRGRDVFQIFVCTSCAVDFEVGEFMDAVRSRVGPGFVVTGHPCFSSCNDPLAVAFRAEGLAAYVFAGLTPDDIGDIVAFADLWRKSPDGWVEDARPAGRLRLCLRARIPAVPISPTR